MDEKLTIKMNTLAGIYLMRPEIFNLIPNNTYYVMDQLINKMLIQRLVITKYNIHDYWLDIGQGEDYEEVQTVFRESIFSYENH
jgi:NDP-sugar pyrophosphorylase family protein